MRLRRAFLPLLLVVASDAVLTGLLAILFLRGAHPSGLLFAALWALVVAGSGALVYRLLLREQRPVETLREMAEKLAAGNLDFTPPIGEAYAFGELFRALELMADSLKKRLEVLERQRNEQKAILSGMVEAVIVLDTDMEIIEVNPAASRLTEMAPAEAKRRPLLEVIRNTDLFNFAQETLSSRQPREASITLAGKERRFLQVHGTVLRRDLSDSDESNVDRVVLVLNDVTKLRSLESIRRDFVANVSHELMTPVTSIKGFIETLRDGAIDDPPTARRFLGILAKQSERLHAIIEDLLSLSRLEQTDGEPLEFSRFNVRETLMDAVGVCSDKAEKRAVRVEVDCDESLTLVGNPVLIEQAVVNLVDNAVKYSGENTTVRVSAESCSAGGETETVEIVVADHGIGIPQKDLPRVFERFYRVEKARSRDLGGTGLGLAIVKHITLSHRGEVFVTSEVGSGSTFTMRLPNPQLPAEKPPRPAGRALKA